MRCIVTGLFGDRAAAARGAAALRALGIPADRIALHDEPAQGVPAATADAPGGEAGLPSLLDALFLPAADLAAHRRALQRGQVVVSATVEADWQDAALRALDDAGALDLDADDGPSANPGGPSATGLGAVGSEAGGPRPLMPGTGGFDAEAARQLATNPQAGGGRDPRPMARQDPPIGRARSYVIDAPLAEEPDAALDPNAALDGGRGTP